MTASYEMLYGQLAELASSKTDSRFDDIRAKSGLARAIEWHGEQAVYEGAINRIVAPLIEQRKPDREWAALVRAAYDETLQTLLSGHWRTSGGPFQSLCRQWEANAMADFVQIVRASGVVK